MQKPIDIIVPTYNNEEYLNPCVVSILKTGVLSDLANLIIVNNGKQDIERAFGGHPSIKILNSDKNLGWEGGLELGLKNSTAPFVVFQNDDTFIPNSSALFYQRLLSSFQDESIAAVGPSTTCAAGLQSIFHPSCPQTKLEVSYLIFFTVMVRRAHLDAVGGVDTQLPGGDDFDLSMRFRKAGYHIVLDPMAFIIHHGFKTGTRVRGTSEMKGGWNSVEMTDRTNQYLIRKHGFKDFFKTLTGLNYSNQAPAQDLEGDIVRSFINGQESIVELGCGGKKTVDRAIGVDRVKKGMLIPQLHGVVSVADVVADVGDKLPFEENSQDVVVARHILEHMTQEIKTLKNWGKIVRPGGKLIIAVPDERVTNGIPLNPEHCRIYTEESLSDVMELLGWEKIETKSAQNGVSFVGVFKKPEEIK